jgi:hypothetical protein
MAEMEATVKFEEVLEQLKQDSPQSSGNLFAPAEKKNYETEPSAKVTFVKPEEPKRPLIQPTFSRSLNLALVQDQWEEYHNHLRRKSAMLSSQLHMGQVRDVKENQIKIVFGSSGLNSKELLERPDNLRTITEDLKQFFQANVSISFEVDKELKMPEIKEKKQVTREDINRMIDQSPRLKKLIEIVDGEIIGVRKVE